jgi:surface protein
MNYINTNGGCIELINEKGYITEVPFKEVYLYFKDETASILLLQTPLNSGKAIFASLASNVEVNGTVYTIDELRNILPDLLMGGGGGTCPDQTDATITSNTVLNGEIGYNNYNKVIGTYVPQTTYLFEYYKDRGFSETLDSYSPFQAYADVSYEITKDWTEYDIHLMNMEGSEDTYLIPNLPITVSNLSYMFYGLPNLLTIPKLDFKDYEDMSYLFGSCINLVSVPLFDTSNVNNMSHMFDTCPKLEYVPSFNTSNVTDMSYMFYGCNNLKDIDWEMLNNRDLVDTSYMFSGTAITKVPDLTDYKEYGVNMEYMFNFCSDLKEVGNIRWVANMTGMFANCWNLEKVGSMNGGTDAFMTKAESGGYTYSKLTDFGGFGGYNSVWRTFNIDALTALTRESLLNVINSLGYIGPMDDEQTLYLSQSCYDRLTPADIQIATINRWYIVVSN